MHLELLFDCVIFQLVSKGMKAAAKSIRGGSTKPSHLDQAGARSCAAIEITPRLLPLLLGQVPDFKLQQTVKRAKTGQTAEWALRVGGLKVDLAAYIMQTN